MYKLHFLPKRHFARLIALLAGVYCLATASAARPARADIVFNVQLNTVPLIGSAAEPFSLLFQLTDGDGVAANNAATLSNFAFGSGGTATGNPALTGGATGSLSTGVTLTDSAFVSEFEQGFAPGDLLSFDVLLTTNFAGGSGGTPDLFSFALLDSSGAELPTLGPGEAFVSVNLNSASPVVQTFASDPNRTPAAGGGPITMSAPQIQVIPEPGTLALIAGGLLPLAAALRRHHRRLTSARF